MVEAGSDARVYVRVRGQRFARPGCSCAHPHTRGRDRSADHAEGGPILGQSETPNVGLGSSPYRPARLGQELSDRPVVRGAAHTVQGAQALQRARPRGVPRRLGGDEDTHG